MTNSYRITLKEKPKFVEWINQKKFLQSKAVYLTPVEKILTQYYRLIAQNKKKIITDDFSDDITIEDQRKIIEEFSYLNNIHGIKQTIIIN